MYTSSTIETLKHFEGIIQLRARPDRDHSYIHNIQLKEKK